MHIICANYVLYYLFEIKAIAGLFFNITFVMIKRHNKWSNLKINCVKILAQNLPSSYRCINPQNHSVLPSLTFIYNTNSLTNRITAIMFCQISCCYHILLRLLTLPTALLLLILLMSALIKVLSRSVMVTASASSEWDYWLWGKSLLEY